MTCETGADALAIMRESGNDVVLTDHLMPEVDGMALAGHANKK